MAINYDAFTKLQIGMLISRKDQPLDGRLIVEEESQIINTPFPYVGLIVYSKKEDKYYKIKTLKNGFDLIDQDTFEPTGKPYPTLQELANANGLNVPTMVEWVDYGTAEDVFAGEYEEIPFDKIGDCNYIIVADEATRDAFVNVSLAASSVTIM